MKIDLFTFIAQIVNFVALVILLYYFLFKKIVRAIDRREAIIRDEFEEAEKRKEEAERTIKEQEKQLSAFNAQKADLIRTAQSQAAEEKERLLEEARSSISEKKEEWAEKLADEKAEFLRRLQEKVAEAAYSIAESAVSDLANTDLQAMIHRQFLETMRTLSEEKVQNFRHAYFEAKEKQIHVLSSFEPSEEEREELEQVFNHLLETEPSITYQIDATQLLGISLRTGGFQFSWNVKDYFETLEATFEKVLAADG